MRDSKLRRRGFTMIEALVAGGVVALLCAIIFPLIQIERESARRELCKNHLKQIGLALHSYHNIHSTFPPGFVVGANDVYQGWSWSLLILPQIEASPWYHQVQFEEGLQTEYLKPALHPHLSFFRCPSDLGADVVSDVAVVTTDVVDWNVTPATRSAKDTFARSNYFGNAGFLHDYAGGIKSEDSATATSVDANINQGSLGTPATKYSKFHRYVDQENFGGVFGQNSKIGFRDIWDGSSNTLIVGERYSPRATGKGQPVIGDGGWLGVPDPTTAAGLAMALGDTSIDIHLNINGRPTTGFGSHHRGGANLLLADGAVRFVGEKIDPQTYRRLSAIADGFPKSCGF